MQVTVALQIGGRTVVEQAQVVETRGGWRLAMTDIACRIEMATFGPPCPVEEMAMEERPVNFSG
jgi:hypothetical protein